MASPGALVLTTLMMLDPRLPAAAAASPRPEPCRSDSFASSSLWSSARPAEAARACAVLARALARLDRAPGEALELARAARLPGAGGDAAALVEARALLRLGKLAEAWQRFAPYFARRASSVDDPRTLHDAGRAALLAGSLEKAAEIYATLVPRAVMLGSERTRRTVTIEAAALALALGPEGLETALGYLTEARRSPSVGDRDLMLGLTALALDRAGRREQALAVAAEASGPWELEGLLSPRELDRLAPPELARLSAPEQTPHDGEDEAGDSGAPPASLGPRPLLPDGELHAVIAMLSDRRDQRMWSAHLRAFVASPAARGPWGDHARRALARGFSGKKP